MKPDGRTVRRLIMGVIGLASGLALMGGTLAQAGPSLSASIIEGSCATPGVVAAPLTDLASAPSSTSGRGAASAAVIPVETSVTTVAMKLADLTDGAHAVDVSLGLACGNLGSQATTGDVVVGLAGDTGSPSSGIVVLHAAGDQTQVTVYLTGNPSGSAEDAQDGGSDEAGESGN